MKTIIAGSRHLKNRETIMECIYECPWIQEITEVVSGGAEGVDAIGEEWADIVGLGIRIFKANWNKYGKNAGPMRNRQMAAYADSLILIWNGESKGSANMLSNARNAGLLIFEVKRTVLG
jgi:hypothetical protein